MLKKTLCILFILLTGLGLLTYKGYFMQVFNIRSINQKEMSDSIAQKQLAYQKYQTLIATQPTVKIPMVFHNINLSDNSIVALTSDGGTSTAVIYYGQYKPRINLTIPVSRFSQENGLDAIKFVFYDKDKMKSYVLEQETPYQFWQPNKEVHVYFLPYREYYDEQFNLFIGYRIELKDISKN